MPEKPKEKAKLPEKPVAGDPSWEADQKTREYYYDDAHGYETYDPDGDGPEEDVTPAETVDKE